MNNINNRFMIVLFEQFNLIRYNRDMQTNFLGVQACEYDNVDEIKKLTEQIKNDNKRLGIHFPLRANQWKFRDPQYLSQDCNQRIESFDFMDKEFKYLKDLDTMFVLLHYPKPVILDDSVDWTNWKFADKTEYNYESEYSYDEFRKKSRYFFQWLSNKSKELNILAILELDAINKYIYDTNLLIDLLEEFDNIKLCIDIGRLHIQDKLDKNFDPFEFISKTAKYVEVVHLWNVQVSSKITHSHYPVLPCQKVEDGWADIAKYIKTINLYNNTYKIVFEHYSDVINDYQLEECYTWIKSLLQCNT